MLSNDGRKHLARKRSQRDYPRNEMRELEHSEDRSSGDSHSRFDEGGRGDSLKLLTLKEASVRTGLPVSSLRRACLDPTSHVRLDHVRMSSIGTIRISERDLAHFIEQLKQASQNKFDRIRVFRDRERI